MQTNMFLFRENKAKQTESCLKHDDVGLGLDFSKEIRHIV